MSGKGSTADDPRQASLEALLRAIGSRNGPLASGLLSQCPALARVALQIGASRQEARAFLFHEIAHYAYAGDTALHIAAAAYHGDMVQALLSRGADVSARNRRGAEPLHYAADGVPGSAAWEPDAQQKIIEVLIAGGADADARDKSGVAPLHRAVRTRCSAAVQALLTNGADPVARNGGGSTPLHLAVQNTGRGGSGSSAAREEQAHIIRLLLDRGARPTDEDLQGRSVVDSVKAGWIRALLAGV